MNGIQDVKLTGMAAFLPAVTTATAEQYETIYEANRDRVYSLAFWMTDNELAAEETLGRVFLRAFSMTDAPSEEMLDRALLTEIRESIAIGTLTLEVANATKELGIRYNTKRVHLERAIVALPATERMAKATHIAASPALSESAKNNQSMGFTRRGFEFANSLQKCAER